MKSIKTHYSVDVKKYLDYFSKASLIASLLIGLLAIIGFSAMFCDSLCLMKLVIFYSVLCTHVNYNIKTSLFLCLVYIYRTFIVYCIDCCSFWNILLYWKVERFEFK